MFSGKKAEVDATVASLFDVMDRGEFKQCIVGMCLIKGCADKSGSVVKSEIRLAIDNAQIEEVKVWWEDVLQQVPDNGVDPDTFANLLSANSGLNTVHRMAMQMQSNQEMMSATFGRIKTSCELLVAQESLTFAMVKAHKDANSQSA